MAGSKPVIPAQAGIQSKTTRSRKFTLDSRLRGNDKFYAALPSETALLAAGVVA